MSILDYIKNKKSFALFYFIIIMFIWAMVYFDSKTNLFSYDVSYVIVVLIIMFLIYSVVDYFRQKTYYDKLNKAMEDVEMDWVNNLPEPKNFHEKKLNEALKKLYNESNMRIQKFSDKSNEDLEFTTAWVHEIKTPIAASRLIIENSIDNPNEMTLYNIEEEIDKVEEYVQKALYYSRINDFSKDYYIQNVRICNVIKECIKKESSSFINKNIKLIIENIDMEVSTDKKWLEFIIKQVVDNSLKYTSKCGNIKIYAEDLEKEIILNIKDDGIGIKEEDIGRVFDKSFTGYNGRKTNNSTGIGLYLSQKLAKKLGHYITISSAFERGTKVTIHFPKFSNYFF